MKSVSIEEFRTKVDDCLSEAARGDLVVTQNGKPWVVVRAIADDLDAESLQRARSAEFWSMIHARRQEPAIPWDEAKHALEID